jgi:hypothetical protein
MARTATGAVPLATAAQNPETSRLHSRVLRVSADATTLIGLDVAPRGRPRPNGSAELVVRRRQVAAIATCLLPSLRAPRPSSEPPYRHDEEPMRLE